ncbi:putative domain Wax2, C-terminal [Cynara cardunculus var. scolymus]|uniref:Putative domain Wax2, C-terminal n=1 Tax=Cynara cardunculus var. scolymus TaxID=59895 RepID=A0A103XEI3_CYNCS|nr:putative domain Wax2, C-terminal [Cynara cardunculus var. scolymus]
MAAVIHPFAEHMAYFALFAIPLTTISLTRTASLAAFGGYVTFIDIMNNMGHCNFELIPKSVFAIFPPLKYIMYTPSRITKRSAFNASNNTGFRLSHEAGYLIEWQREAINGLIEAAILEAEGKGIKVLGLGLLNQFFVRRNPGLKVRVVDGSSLVVAVVLNSIPAGTTEVVFRGNFNKVASYLALALCRRGIKVGISQKDHYQMLKSKLKSTDDQEKLFLSQTYSHKNWLPRRVMSAWRIAGIVHGLEGWNVNECGNQIFDIDKVWEAALRHGFTLNKSFT